MMLSRIKVVLACLTCLLGIIHIICAFPIQYYDKQTLWFIGSGMAIVYAGLINLIAANSTRSFTRIVCAVSNLITVCLFVGALIALQEIQVFVGIVLFAAQAVLVLIRKNA